MSKLAPVILHAVADLETKVEAKVKAASTASAATGFIVTLLGGLTVFHGGAVPSVITAAIGALVTGGLTFAAGYMAKHTPRAISSPTTAVPTVQLLDSTPAAPAVPAAAAPPATPTAPTA
jgi:hypothetical protein